MSKNYRNITAEKQIDETTCWAAALVWWLKAVRNRTDFTQEDLLQEYIAYWRDAPDGAITKYGMSNLVYDARWRMSVQWPLAFQFFPTILREHLARGPIYIAYYEKKVKGNHVNVIYEAIDSGDSPRLRVMEPNGGKHKVRPFSYYQGVGELILASPLP
jgi:hypothetical protein